MKESKEQEGKSLQSTREGIEKRRHPTPEMLISEAINKGITVETMKELLAMRTQLKAEQAKEAYYLALAEFQAECPIIFKKKDVLNKEEKGGGVRYKFAPLDAIVKQAGSCLQKNGLSYTFKSKQTTTDYTAICISQHSMGHSESTEFTVPIDAKAYMNAPQKVGSARTFANRYAFCNAFGILTGDEDNDAQSYNGNQGEQTPVKQEKTREYEKLELRILAELEADCFTGKIDMDGKQWDLDEAAIQLKTDLSENIYAMDGLAKTYDMIARMSLIAQERDKVQVNEKGEEALSDGELEFDEAVDAVKPETEGNLSE